MNVLNEFLHNISPFRYRNRKFLSDIDLRKMKLQTIGGVLSEVLNILLQIANGLIHILIS